MSAPPPPPAPTTVGATALLIAAARARETQRPPAATRLFADPLADLLATDFGHDFLGALSAVYGNEEVRRRRPVTGFGCASQEQVTKFAVRTRYLDDRLRAHAAIPQLVILGVGCDTRPYRLGHLADTEVFEVDLPEVVAWRGERLRGLPALCRRLVPVAGDLRRHDWGPALVEAGYHPDVPAVWLLEGLLMYFTEAEARRLMSGVRRLLAPGSVIIGNCLAGDCVARWDDYYAAWARYAPPPTLALPDPLGWLADQGLLGTAVPLGHRHCNYGRLPEVPWDPEDAASYSGVLFFEAAPDVGTPSSHPAPASRCTIL